MKTKQYITIQLAVILLVERKSLEFRDNIFEEVDPFQISIIGYRKAGGLYEFLHQNGFIVMTTDGRIKITQKGEDVIELLCLADICRSAYNLKTALSDILNGKRTPLRVLIEPGRVLAHSLSTKTQNQYSRITPPAKEDYREVLQGCERQWEDLKDFLNRK